MAYVLTNIIHNFLWWANKNPFFRSKIKPIFS